MDERFLSLLAEILEEELKPDDRFRDFGSWDSLAYLSVISAIDEEYDLVIPQDDFRNLMTVSDIWNYIQERRN